MDFEDGEVFTTLKMKIAFKDRNSLKVVSTQYVPVTVEQNWYGETKRIRTERRGGGKKKRDGENWLFVIGLVLCCLENSLICWGDELSVLNFDRDLQREVEDDCAQAKEDPSPSPATGIQGGR